MAPRKFTQIRTYFQYVTKSNTSFCLINKDDEIGDTNGIISDRKDPLCCNQKLKGNKCSNLKSHASKCHKNVYKHYTELVIESTKMKNVPKPEENDAQSAITKHYPKKSKDSCCITVSKSTVLKSLISKFTLDGRPFVAIEDVSYSLFLCPAMKLLNLSYNRHNVHELLERASLFIKKKIAKEVENTLISVKVDCVSRLNRSFLGINIQIVKNGKIQIYTLSVKEILERHIAENLKTLILDELKKYAISAKNIYTITSDSGSNLVKAIKLIEEEVREENKDMEINNEVEEDDPAIADDEYYQDMILKDCAWEGQDVIGIRCAAHVLQLGIQDTLKNSFSCSWADDPEDSYSVVIAEARKLVKELRTQNSLILLRKKGLQIPPLDTQTRWSSTHKMLCSLIKLRQFCNECVLHGNKKLKLSKEMWAKIEEICLSLEPAQRATKKLQQQNITLSDIFKILNVCHMRTAQIGSSFSQELVLNLTKRRDTITENPVMLSCIYLDPRLAFELSTEQKSIAIKHIQNTHHRLLSLQAANEIIESSEDTDSNSMASGMVSDDEDLIYERLLRRKHHQIKRTEQQAPSFDAALISFQQIERLNSKEVNILTWWQENKETFALLFPVARIILGVPGTQCSVEQLFSQVKFILNDLRGCLDSTNVQNIMLIRCNFACLDEFYDTL